MKTNTSPTSRLLTLPGAAPEHQPEAPDPESAASSTNAGTSKPGPTENEKLIATPDDFNSQDLFNPECLRLSQNFGDMVGVKKILTTVPVRRPDKQSFVRVHPDSAYRLETAVLELKEERETYLVEPRLISELPGEVTPKILFTAINRQGVVFFWPVRLPRTDGRQDSWGRTELQAAEEAMKNWVRTRRIRCPGDHYSSPTTRLQNSRAIWRSVGHCRGGLPQTCTI